MGTLTKRRWVRCRNTVLASGSKACRGAGMSPWKFGWYRLVWSEESRRISRHTSIAETTVLSCQADGFVGVCGGARPPMSLMFRCSRIFRMTRGWVMKATMRSVPPQGHRSGSSSKTLRIKSAHRRRNACFEAELGVGWCSWVFGEIPLGSEARDLWRRPRTTFA